MDWTLEVVLLPVSDIDRAVSFYRDQVGFDLDHDTKTPEMHIVQLTPSGSGCSIVIGPGGMPPGSLKGVQLRWRGVVVRCRLGQTGSQKPHSTHAFADSSIGGVVFRLRRWTPGSRLSTTPGASTPSGSLRWRKPSRPSTTSNRYSVPSSSL